MYESKVLNLGNRGNFKAFKPIRKIGYEYKLKNYSFASATMTYKVSRCMKSKHFLGINKNFCNQTEIIHTPQRASNFNDTRSKCLI